MKNLEKYLIDFDTLQEGDSAWSIQEGDCKVSFIKNDIINYCLISVNGIANYRKDGKISPNDKMPSLFKSNPFKVISEYPKMMEVSNNGELYHARKVIYKTFNAYVVLNDEEDDTDFYSFAREIQSKKVTLTLEEIAKLANCNVEDLEIKQ